MDDEEVTHICLINKKSLIKCLQKHEVVFQEIVGKDFSVETFVEQLERTKTLRPLIRDDECLLGLILGFGLDSAAAFKEQTSQLTTKTYPAWTESYQGIEISLPKRCLIYPIGFMGNPHSKEVKKLVKIYSHEIEQLWMGYKGPGNLLKALLEQLCTLDNKSANCHVAVQ